MTTQQHFVQGDTVGRSHPGDVFPVEARFPDARPIEGLG